MFGDDGIQRENIGEDEPVDLAAEGRFLKFFAYSSPVVVLAFVAGIAVNGCYSQKSDKEKAETSQTQFQYPAKSDPKPLLLGEDGSIITPALTSYPSPTLRTAVVVDREPIHVLDDIGGIHVVNGKEQNPFYPERGDNLVDAINQEMGYAPRSGTGHWVLPQPLDCPQ